MKTYILAILCVLFVATSCKKPDIIRPNKPDIFNHFVGNSLFNYGLLEYSGPDTDHKLIFSKDYPALQTAGIVFKAYQVIEIVDGQPQWVNRYKGTIYQGPGMFWPTKDASNDFPVTYLTDTTFMLGTEQTGFNLGKFDGEGETLEINETYPVVRYYKYGKKSD